MAVRLTTLREEATAGLQPHLDAYAKCLNALVKGMPQGSIAEKRALRQWLNKEVSSRGLAVRCPNTGAPSLLQVDPGEYPEVGRFQFYHMEEGERVRTASRTRLPELQVILADLAVSLDLDPSLPGEVGPDDAGQEGDGWAASEDQRRDSRSPRNKP